VRSFVVGRERGTQQHAGKENRSIESLLDYRGNNGSRGDKRDKKAKTGETKDVTWGSQTSPQVYYKYGPSEGESESSVRPVRGV